MSERPGRSKQDPIPPIASASLAELAPRWDQPGRGAGYRRQAKAAARAIKDGRQVARLLGRAEPGQRLLDCPGGSGRLWSALRSQGFEYLAVDAALGMLDAHPERRQVLVGRVEALPLADGCIDWAVCCRLLHHLPCGPAWTPALRELARVARRGVLFSFFDACSWPAWRARQGGLERDRAGRWYTSRAQVTAACLAAGLPAPSFHPQSGWFSAQCFARSDRPRATLS